MYGWTDGKSGINRPLFQKENALTMTNAAKNGKLVRIDIIILDIILVPNPTKKFQSWTRK